MRSIQILMAFTCYWLLRSSIWAAQDTNNQPVPKSGYYHNDYIIGQFISTPWGFNTNSFWIAGPTGIVLIDTQFLPSAAVQAVQTAESYTGKKVVLAIVLHANPDKFNGTAALKARGIKVVTSKAIHSLIPAVDTKRRAWFYDRYKPDYPAELVLPEIIDDDQNVINAAGLSFKLHRFGPAVSKAHLVIEFDKHLFVGDLIANRYHGWMELGMSPQWIELLKNLQQLQPKVIHPGRGFAAGPELIASQIQYLQFVQNKVQAQFDGKPLTDAKAEALTKVVSDAYTDYGLEYFLNLGLPAEYNRLLETSPK